MIADVKKRGLGRGLDALFREIGTDDATPPAPVKRAAEIEQAAQPAAAASSAGAAPRRLPVDKLTPGAFQPRRLFREDALAQLAESIAVHGVLQPLLVRPLGNGTFEIIAGERRWRAAQKARVHDVPVVIRDMSDSDALEIGLIENLQREDLTPIEEAEGYQRLIDEFGHTAEVLAGHLGKSRPHIANTLRLLKLPASVRSMVQAGVLSAGHARALVGATNADTLAGIIVKRGLNVRQTEKLAAQAAEGKPVKAAGRKPEFRQKDVDILALEEKMTSLLGLRVSIEAQGPAGKITIAYKSLDQLDDVLERLSSVPKK